ncbi:cytochrome c5 family protein [Catenovulum sp. SM1970]|nr:c-type cytochrome [Marinifaba aquimaris]NTS75935.1 cytochrome c5 family protein [Marinifaba aquimaris]
MASDNDLSQKAVKERTMPIGSVHVAGAAPANAAARSGSDVYNTYCMACHGSGVMNAPKAFDEAAWAPRVEKGLDTILKSAISGIGMMPAKGGCMDCSDDEIKAAIEHMLGK